MLFEAILVVAMSWQHIWNNSFCLDCHLLSQFWNGGRPFFRWELSFTSCNGSFNQFRGCVLVLAIAIGILRINIALLPNKLLTPWLVPQEIKANYSNYWIIP